MDETLGEVRRPLSPFTILLIVVALQLLDVLLEKLKKWLLQRSFYCSESCRLYDLGVVDISHCLWDEVKQSEDTLIYMLEEQTPIKDCADFGYHTTNIEDNINKLLEECRDSSQQKRRRVLHFSCDSNDSSICNVQPTSVFLKSKEREDEQMDDGGLSSSSNIEWSPQWDIGFSERIYKQ